MNNNKLPDKIRAKFAKKFKKLLKVKIFNVKINNIDNLNLNIKAGLSLDSYEYQNKTPKASCYFDDSILNSEKIYNNMLKQIKNSLQHKISKFDFEIKNTFKEFKHVCSTHQVDHMIEYEDISDLYKLELIPDFYNYLHSKSK